MATDLHPDIVAAIRDMASTKLGRRYNRFAKKRYGVSGAKLAGKTVAGEFGGRSTETGRGVVSSAGARGPAQFIPSTREAYMKQYGVDPWAGDKQAVKGMMLHHLSTGVEGYNPGMPTYKDYILGQKLNPEDRKALRGAGGAGGGAGGRGPDGSFKLKGKTQTTVSSTDQVIPGQSFAAERGAARRELLTGGDIDLKSLLAYKSTVNSMRDVPDRTVPGAIQVNRTTGPGMKVRTKGAPQGGGPTDGRALPNSGRGLNEMFKIAERVDKLNNGGKVPYQWGGGHGASPAKPGTPVDCSGFVSQVLGVAPRVSGAFASSWGKPGGGKWVTVYANGSHVLMSMRDPETNQRRWFGTSQSNPGGGGGEIAPPSSAYLSKFVKRHPGKE